MAQRNPSKGFVSSVTMKELTMKKIILVAAAAFAVASCNLSDDGDTNHYELGPVKDVTMASAYKVDSISEIIIRYKRPSQCDYLSGYYYEAQGMTRVCAMEYLKTDHSDCPADTVTYQVPLKFKPRSIGTYTFKFWDGNNDDGTEHFFVADAVVDH
jgi:hypothetical protein